MKWHPDTCSCIVEVENGIGVGTVRACADHRGIPTLQLYTVLLEENRRKNNFETHLNLAAPELKEEVPCSLQAMTTIWRRTVAALNNGTTLDEAELLRGLTVPAYRDGQGYEFTFDHDRVLVVDGSRFPPAAFAAATALAQDSKYAGKVRIGG